MNFVYQERQLILVNFHGKPGLKLELVMGPFCVEEFSLVLAMSSLLDIVQMNGRQILKMTLLLFLEILTGLAPNMESNSLESTLFTFTPTVNMTLHFYF